MSHRITECDGLDVGVGMGDPEALNPELLELYKIRVRRVAFSVCVWCVGGGQGYARGHRKRMVSMPPPPVLVTGTAMASGRASLAV